MEVVHNFVHCIIESYQNGFYPMQNWYETIGAIIGSSVWNIIHLGGLI